jgi:hypothetical protein
MSLWQLLAPWPARRTGRCKYCDRGYLVFQRVSLLIGRRADVLCGALAYPLVSLLERFSCCTERSPGHGASGMLTELRFRGLAETK